MDVILCIRRVSGYLEGKYVERSRDKKSRIQVSQRIFGKCEEIIWWRRQ